MVSAFNQSVEESVTGVWIGGKVSEAAISVVEVLATVWVFDPPVE